MPAVSSLTKGAVVEKPLGDQVRNVATPLVSIILPTFNRLQFLPAAITSVESQTVGDWELIVADDGSGLETREYLATLSRDPRIRVLFLPHSGSPGAVRNAALRIARAKYVAFLDSDDAWLPQKLAVQTAALDAQPECQWSYTEFVRIDATGKSTDLQRNPDRTLHQGAITEQLLTERVGIALPTVMAHRQLLTSLECFDEQMDMHEDYDLWLRLSVVSKVVVVTTPLGYVRRHGEHFSSGGIRPLLGRSVALRKISTVIVDQQLMSVCDAERARNASALARAYAANGQLSLGFKALTGDWQSHCRHAAWYRGIAVAAICLIAPSWFVRQLRRLREPTARLH